jgi:hypothetical protein
MTAGIQAMIEDSDISPSWFDTGNLLRIVSNFTDFGEDNNPHGDRVRGLR